MTIFNSENEELPLSKHKVTFKQRIMRKLPLVVLIAMIGYLVFQGVLATSAQIANKYEEKIIAPLVYSQKLIK